MSQHEKFNYQSLSQIEQKVKELCVDVSFDTDISILSNKVRVGNKIAPNSIAVLPMEGCDSNPDGSPSELTKRRYTRFAQGGAGLLWWEACAICEEGKANPLSMMITKENVLQFKELLQKTKQLAREKNGENNTPINILQLTHSGRYSRPNEKSSPIIPQHDPLLDPRVGLKGDEDVVTDEYLDSLPEKYVHSALLAKEAGFDGVDIKACHRYLMNELLASYTRSGKYGGSFLNRTRLLRNTIREVRKAVGNDFIIACRFNVFDAHPYPYGFGCSKENMWEFDESEPMQLVKMLCDEGVNLLSNSAGNPYYIYPQVTRPFDTSSMGIPIPSEHQLESTARLFEFTRRIQRQAGTIPVVGNGYSWLRQFAPFAGVANIKSKSCTFMGLGRSSFAYPDAPYDILNYGKMYPNKCCIACSKCTQIMRDHGKTGCVIRDSKVYLPQYQVARKEASLREGVFQ